MTECYITMGEILHKLPHCRTIFIYIHHIMLTNPGTVTEYCMEWTSITWFRTGVLKEKWRMCCAVCIPSLRPPPLYPILVPSQSSYNIGDHYWSLKLPRGSGWQTWMLVHFEVKRTYFSVHYIILFTLYRITLLYNYFILFVPLVLPVFSNKWW